jgi:hypothetical protein
VRDFLSAALTVTDVRRLIEFWCRNLLCTGISQALNRSVSGVHGKARRLGLYRRERTALMRELPQPPTASATGTAGDARRAGREVRWAQGLEDELADRWFAFQHHRATARDMGLSPSAAELCRELGDGEIRRRSALACR